MSQPHREEQALVLEAFDTLFTNGITQRPSVTGPRTTFNTALISTGPGCSISSRDPANTEVNGIDRGRRRFVIVHGRFSGFGAPVNWIAADILRIENGYFRAWM